jgi:hypothetical protein
MISRTQFRIRCAELEGCPLSRHDMCAHLFRRRRYKDGIAIENLEEDRHEVVQKSGVLLALAVGFDIVSYVERLCAFCSQIYPQSACRILKQLVRACRRTPMGIVMYQNSGRPASRP